MEGEIGRFRRRHLTPVPHGGVAGGAERVASPPPTRRMTHRRIAARAETVGQAAAREAPLLNPLPGNAFDAARRCRAGSTRRPGSACGSRTTRCRPALAGRRVQVALGADRVDRPARRGYGRRPARPVAAQGHRGSWCWTTTWRSWRTSPGALAGATALVRGPGARGVHRGAPTVLGRRPPQLGDRDGTRALIGVLLLHRTLPAEAVLAGIDAAAVAAGRCDPDLVAVEARRHLDRGRSTAAPVPAGPAPAAGRRRRGRRPRWHGYDELLAGAGMSPRVRSRPAAPPSPR